MERSLIRALQIALKELAKEVRELRADTHTKNQIMTKRIDKIYNKIAELDGSFNGG